MAPNLPDPNDVELTTERFEDLDLDPRAKRILKDKGYVFLTHVQSKVLPLALSGKNLIIQSPTGSGKTLCFLLPAVKLLFDEGYYGTLPADVSLLGCICLASTRELATQSAIQMNDLAESIGIKAGCCIGGIRNKFDKSNAHKYQILTGTPGRVLSLLSDQSIIDTGNVKLLVLDEADRLLDSGFRNDILSILSYLPTHTQILLFSATIKSSLQNLCDSLLEGKEYEYICMGSDAALLSESKLRQEYIVVPVSLKLPALYHLLCKNQRKRFIVFVATCKQVRYVFEVMKRLIPAVPMTEWHGRQSQLKRNEQFTRFAAKQHFGCIFTTDVAARGVDFPAVDYVIQLDIPDSVTTYTHRVGRTGRLTVEGTRSFGNAFSIVGENETAFVDSLKVSGVKIHNLTKLIWPLLLRKEEYVLKKLQALLAKEAWIKEIAQRAVIAYMRYLSTRQSVTLAGTALVEAVQQMALSLGLPTAPHIEVAEEPNQAKKSKLSKLKEKINSKKLKNRKDQSELDAEHVNSTKQELSHVKKSGDAKATEKDAFSIKLQDQYGYDSDDEEQLSGSSDDWPDGKTDGSVSDSREPVGKVEKKDDDLLKRATNANVEDDLRLYMERKAAENNEEIQLKSNLASSRKKLRLNRHGVAKIRGIETIRQTEQKHTVFDADSDAEEDHIEESAPLAQLAEEKIAYINRVSEQLKSSAAHDHEWEARRRAIKRAKKLNKPLPF
ncbi:RNA helicase [Babesia gibsoni]|uniref:ATP-dependent RNA helicase n=1 Tax=Babesia gibsoni TaxID=33632 RepID=A0AAD8PDP5_BABGI|nr:RNA helicase [Babesia gibsoni]